MSDAVHRIVQDHNAGRGATSSSPPRTLAQLLSSHAQVAADLAGVSHTSWNGLVAPAADGIAALAAWDGTLHLARDQVLDPLHRLYAEPSRSQSSESLTRVRQALFLLLREQSLFLGPPGSTRQDARPAYGALGGRSLEEGVAEVWSHANLSAYLRRLEIPASGIGQLTTPAVHAAFVPATRLLTSELDRRAHLPAGRALHLLNQETARSQWPLVTELFCRPYASRPQQEIRHLAEHRLRTAFQSLEALEGLPHELAAHRSHRVLHTTLTGLTQELAHPPSPISAEQAHLPPLRTRLAVDARADQAAEPSPRPASRSVPAGTGSGPDDRTRRPPS